MMTKHDETPLGWARRFNIFSLKLGMPGKLLQTEAEDTTSRIADDDGVLASIPKTRALQDGFYLEVVRRWEGPSPISKSYNTNARSSRTAL